MTRYPSIWKHPGFLSSYITGRRGRERPDPRHVNLIAKFLHVEFAWLLLGDGPMLRGGREETAAEQAMRVARQLGVREDAWEAAWERNRDRIEEMKVEDWMDAIQMEHERLKRHGVPVRALTPANVAKQIAVHEETAEVLAVARRRQEILTEISDAAAANARKKEIPDETRAAGAHGTSKRRPRV